MCLQTGCDTQAEYDVRCGEIEVRKDRAAAGRLTPPDADEADPVRSQPLLWEIRWQFGQRQLRMYHAEPRKRPELLLALKYHWKTTSLATQDLIDAAQDAEMADAASRYVASPLHPGPGLDD